MGDEYPADIPSLGDIRLENFAPYLLNRAARQWNDSVTSALGVAAMTTPQLRILAVLSISESLSINELAERTVTGQSTMSRALDGLEALGLALRTRRENDQRVREISITETGRARFGEVWPIMYRCFTEGFAGLDRAEYEALLAILRKIMANTAAAGGES